MTLRDIIAMREMMAVDPSESAMGLTVLAPFHPPSLKNPIKVKQDIPADGWHRSDSPAAKRRARQDLVLIMQRTIRQAGRPSTADYGAITPWFPDTRMK
jgi:hypothetical protein